MPSNISWAQQKYKLLATPLVALLALSGCLPENEDELEDNQTEEYTLRAFVENLNDSGMVLQNNSGDNTSPDENGNVTFPTKLKDGSDYNVTILTQPSSQLCSVKPDTGSGEIDGADVSDVRIECKDLYTLRAFVENLKGSGMVLQNNNGDNTSPDVRGNVTFPSKLIDGSFYDVTILTQPSSPAQDCSVNTGTGSGNINGADVSEIWMVCTDLVTADMTINDQSPAANAEHVALDEEISLTFSANVNASTVSEQTILVSSPEGSVNGTFAVNGTQVVFTPDNPLQSLAEYQVSVTTTVEDVDGNSLGENFTFDFDTTIDTSKWYRLTNRTLGENKSLDTSNPDYRCFMGDNGNFTGQYWRFVPSNTQGYYLMFSRFAGEREGLEGGSPDSACLFTGFADKGNPFSGQMWKISSEGDNYFRMKNLNLQSTHSLGVTTIPTLLSTDTNSEAQQWMFSEIGDIDNVSLNQFVYVSGIGYDYGAANAIPNIDITNAPSDADFGRWAMLSQNTSSYKVMAIKRGTNDTLYEFVYNASTEDYERSSKTYKITDIPAEANTSSIAMLHSDVGEHLYMLDKSDLALHQFLNTAGNDDFVYGGNGAFKKIDITGGPSDVDWSRWAMLHDGGKYRFYTMKQGSNDTFYQFVYNSASGDYEYGFGGAITSLTITGIPVLTDLQSFTMLHDGDKYRLYMLSR